MNETICELLSAIEEGHSWGHTDREIAEYIYEKYIMPLEHQLAGGTDSRAAFLEGFMLSTPARNGRTPFEGNYAQAWRAIASHSGAGQEAFRVIREINPDGEDPYDPGDAS